MGRLTYIPDRGDIVFLNFSPTAGHEQKGTRPAIIISPKMFNQVTGLAFLCPITSQIKGYPFEVVLENTQVVGAVLVDQMRSIDFQARQIEYRERIHDDILEMVLGKLKTIIF